MQTQKEKELDYIYSIKTDLKKKTIQLAAQKVGNSKLNYIKVSATG